MADSQHVESLCQRAAGAHLRADRLLGQAEALRAQGRPLDALGLIAEAERLDGEAAFFRSRLRDIEDE